MRILKLLFMLSFLGFIILTGCSNENKAAAFNRKAALPENKADEIIKALNIQEGSNILDLGSGGGYFSFRFAKETGSEGKAYAVDINKGYLSYVEKQAKDLNLKNLTTVDAGAGELNIPEGSIDLIYIRNVYHHMDDRVPYFTNMKRYLKNDGKVVIIDFKEPSFFMCIMGYYVSPQDAEKEMTEAGYKKAFTHDFLTDHYFFVFTVNKLEK